MCRTKGASYTKLLTNTGESDTYLRKWKLYVPKNCITQNKTEDELI